MARSNRKRSRDRSRRDQGSGAATTAATPKRTAAERESLLAAANGESSRAPDGGEVADGYSQAQEAYNTDVEGGAGAGEDRYAEYVGDGAQGQRLNGVPEDDRAQADDGQDEDEQDLSPAIAAASPRVRRSGMTETHPAPRELEHENLATRTARFLQGSWRELQRVQWPDRRQVMQATGVVIGFVIVAGVILGVSDLISEKIVNFIINH